METVVWRGGAVSGRVVDLGGGWFNGGKLTELVIESVETTGGWDRPEGVVIKNGRIRGCIRIMGMGRNGEARRVRKSSVRAGHTVRAQAAAPSGIRLEDLHIEASRAIPVYVAPGVTETAIEGCTFTGWSVGPAIYLDAESARNVINRNRFELRCFREVIAVDGSAGNRIEGNQFSRIRHGGVYLYRNCGEGGAVRHQSPQDNVIFGNTFHSESMALGARGIWMGSRNGRRSYCGCDSGHPFGSSVDDRDFADHNTVRGNVFHPDFPGAVMDEGSGNVVAP